MSSPTAAGGPASLVDLLGDSRGEIVSALRDGARTVAELAERVGLSEVAVRRHLHILERDGLVEAETVREERRGRPSSHHRLTDRGRRLFPDRSAELASELLEFLEQRHGRGELGAFLRWRSDRQARRLTAAVAGAGSLEERVEALADVLDEDGFAAAASAATAPDGTTVLQLTQRHCAVADVAKEHPELCAYEASLFRDVLGARLSRRETIAGGADACVCHVTPNET